MEPVQFVESYSDASTLQANLTRVPYLGIWFVVAWFGTMLFTFVALLTQIPPNLVTPLVLTFLISFGVAPLMIAYWAFIVFRFRPVDLTITNGESIDGSLHIFYLDRKGKQHDEKITSLKILAFDTGTLVLKTRPLQELWIKLYSEEEMDQVINLAYPQPSGYDLDDIEATARTFYPLDSAIFALAPFVAFVLSSELWQRMLFFLLFFGIISFYIFCYYHYPRQHLFKIKGVQIVAEVEEPTFLDNFGNRVRIAISTNSIRVNSKRKQVCMGSIFKSYHILSTPDSLKIESWFSRVKKRVDEMEEHS